MQNTEHLPFLQKHQTNLMLVLVLTFFVIFPVTTHASVGKVIMAIGEVSINRSGKLIPVKKDAVVEVGDAIVTGNTSNAQVKFNDGAIVALRPNTEFKVNEYKFNGKPDGTEKADVSLTKGGVRAVTGAIGRSNRDNLKVNAAVATIGIRGTGFNIVFCDASCIDKSPQSKEGLYAGVFEGKIVVANKGGTSSDMGVNRFAYVANENSAPQPLIAPPNFLKDSLEAQVRVKVKDLNLNSATDSNSVDGNANAVVKSPTAKAEVTPNPESILKIDSPFLRPEVATQIPRTYFVAVPGNGVEPVVAVTPGLELKLRAAEWNTQIGNDSVQQIDLDRLLTPTRPPIISENVGTADVPVIAFKQFSTAYSIISPTDPASFMEGGADGGVIAWGRWANGTAKIGASPYGDLRLERDQGWHYIVGLVPTGGNFTDGNHRFDLLAATAPTELRANAQSGWQFTGGSISVIRQNSVTSISGQANLSLARSEGWGNFIMSWSHSNSQGETFFYLPPNVNGNPIPNMTVVRTDGTVNLCTAGCAGLISTGFYSNEVSPTIIPKYAGSTYQFNTGSYSVNGALVFQKKP